MKLTKSSRAFRRATAFVLAAAMTLSAPVATQASAASKKKVPSLSVKKKTLYYNQAGKKSFTLKVKKNKVKKIVKTKWTTSKKSIVGISAKKKTKVKVTAKKKGTAKITAKVTYRLKAGSKAKTKKLVCKVTSKKKSSVVTPVPATDVPATDVPATDVPATDVPATDVPATDVPSTEPSAEPSVTPAAISVTVMSSSNITKDKENGKDFFYVALKLAETDVLADSLKDTKITLKSAKPIEVTAMFKDIDKDGKAIYVIDDAAKLTPGDTTANGKYVITSNSPEILKISADGVSAEYEESLAGNAVEGYVLTTQDLAAAPYKVPVANALVTVEDGQSVLTDAEGHYYLPSVTGRKQLTVSCNGFVTKYLTGADRVYINKSHVTSQNISLTRYDVKKLGIQLTVQDSVSSAGVKDAKVVLEDASGKVLKDGTTNASGQITFGNNNATVVGTDKKATAENLNYLAQGTYTLKISKLLTANNVDQVYEEITEKITLTDDYDNPKTVKIVKTAALKSFEVTQNLKENAATAYTNANSKIDATYALYTKVHGNNVDAPVIATTASVESAAISSAKSAVTNIFAALKTVGKGNGSATANVTDLTLPSGDYYLMVSPAVATGQTSAYTPAIGVYKLAITAGGDAKVSVDLTEGNVRTINSQITLPNAVSGAVQASGSALYAVKWNATPAPGAYVLPNDPAPWDSTQIKAAYTIKQVVEAGVEIKINGSAIEEGYVKGTDGAYASTTRFANFLGNGTYKIESVGDYSVPVDPQTEVINNDKGSVNFKINGAANPVEAIVKVTADSALVGVVVGSAPVLTKVVAYNTAGEAVSTLDYSKTPVDKSKPATVGAAGASLAPEDTLKYRIDTAKMNLPIGTYTFGITLDGYKEVKTDSVAVNAIEKVGLYVGKKLEKATADANAISGEVKLLNENGKGYQTLDNSSVKITNGTVVLYTADKKIAAISDVTWDIGTSKYTYRLEDKSFGGMYTVAAGTYTMVVRAANTETYVETVTIADGNQLTRNVDLVPGALGEIKAFALDSGNRKMAGDYNAVALAFDEYYVNPSKKANYATGEAKVQTAEYNRVAQLFALGSQGSFGKGTGFFGMYQTASIRGGDASYSYTENGVQMDGYYVFNQLPAGNYTVNVGAHGYAASDPTEHSVDDFAYGKKYEYAKESVTLAGIGDIVKREWSYAPVGQTAATVTAPLTINLRTNGVLTPSNTKPFVAVIENVTDGKVEKIVRANAPADLEKIPVPIRKEYKVSVYTYEGKQVASNTINVERAAATVEVAVNGSDVD